MAEEYKRNFSRSSENCRTRTNSQDNIQKNSCSHNQYCLFENNSTHKSSCYCHQSPVLLNRNSSDHHTFEREKKQVVEIRSSIRDKPLTTIRLQPARVATEKEIFTILSDGQVCVEFIKKKEDSLALVCFVSPDGSNIKIFKPKRNILPSEKPPYLPDSVQEVQCYSFENLPKNLWKRYWYAKRFVNIVRSITPKVTIYGEDAKCVMMENAPCPDYYVKFYDGYKIKEIEDKITVIDQIGIELTDENKQDCHVENLLNTFKIMKNDCCFLEACVEKWSKTSTKAYFPLTSKSRPNLLLWNSDNSKEKASPRSMHSSTLNRTIDMKERFRNLEAFLENLSYPFPVIYGRRPNLLLRNLDNNKENASPRSMPSSTLSGTIDMKSYSGTINTDSSSCTTSSPASIPSPLSNRKSTRPPKNIT